jgi:hypothetical protein
MTKIDLTGLRNSDVFQAAATLTIFFVSVAAFFGFCRHRLPASDGSVPRIVENCGFAEPVVGDCFWIFSGFRGCGNGDNLGCQALAKAPATFSTRSRSSASSPPGEFHVAAKSITALPELSIKSGIGSMVKGGC